MNMRENATETTPDMRENSLRDAIREEMRRGGVSQPRLARESGISVPRINQWLSGKYKGDNAAIEKALQSWLRSALESREQAASGCIPAAPDWMPTLTANKILLALKYAHKLADITVIYGGAGLGKTLTAQRYQEDNPNVWIATMTPSVISVTACLERVAYAVGVNHVPAGGAQAEQAIVSRVSGSGGLIVVDEAQHLPVTCLDALRSLYDASGVGLAIMGNESVYTQLTGGSRKAHFAQLFSRIGRRERLTSPTAGDIDALLKPLDPAYII
ncbi:AAA family ATPase [Desulfovibrio sp. PG-178-WT-4]|uniref:AAA family ATPase n=1 Tax=Desulfovibrio porci TaxID=2605782 RepID=A0A6L5XLQ2_9BACT|nr:AAA family ATPase [Desulfovibrio porci]MSS28096.1 AAA family ATPase [Desulfovibrio porci]